MVLLAHMLDYGSRATAKVSGLDWDDFERDENLRLAVVHLIQIVGEAARHVSEKTQRKYSHIPWSDIIGMRHRLVNNYINIKYRIAWQVATIDLPQLITQLEQTAKLCRTFKNNTC